MDRTSTTWSTKDEIAYLGKIGESEEKWRSLSPAQKIKKKINLLKNYIKATEWRKKWAGIDKEHVVLATQKLLEELTV